MGHREIVLSRLHGALRTGSAAVRTWAPYVLLELLLPGGTLMAVLLYAHQRLRELRGAGAAGPHARTVASAAAWRRLPVTRADGAGAC